MVKSKATPTPPTIVAITPNTNIEIALSPEFEHGSYRQTLGVATNNNSFITDFPQMDSDSRATFNYLVDQLSNSLDQEGRNKPSWLKTNGTRCIGADIYELFNVWHYHCGSWDLATKVPLFTTAVASAHTTAKDLQANPLGKTSGPCIHFTWENNGKRALILAYSERHTPFVKASDPDNRLSARILDNL